MHAFIAYLFYLSHLGSPNTSIGKRLTSELTSSKSPVRAASGADCLLLSGAFIAVDLAAAVVMGR